jgi:glutamate/tyrosine decarboxylase-like PLP-dependent enzyme
MCTRRTFAQGLATIPGCQVLNDVVVNQVLFRFDDDQTTDRVLRRVIDSGKAWMSGTTVNGRQAIRLSVCPTGRPVTVTSLAPSKRSAAL